MLTRMFVDEWNEWNIDGWLCGFVVLWCCGVVVLWCCEVSIQMLGGCGTNDVGE